MLKGENFFVIIFNGKEYTNAEVYTAKEISFLYRDKINIATKDNEMEKLNINLRDATYYLIQFFYKTEKKYSCTQTKIGKMLSILVFKYAKDGKQLFYEKIYKYPPRCGTLIKDLTFIPKDIYIRDTDIEDPDGEEIINIVFNDSVEIPDIYTNINNLTDDIKKEIECLFRHFGTYPASKLGEYLNPIVDKFIVSNSDEISLERMKYIDIEDFSDSEINDIIKYIY